MASRGLGTGGGFRVDLDSMQASAERVYEIKAQVETDLARLDRALGPLSALWRGSAGQDFLALVDHWQDDAGQLISALQALGDYLDRSRANYESADHETRQTLERLLDWSRE